MSTVEITGPQQVEREQRVRDRYALLAVVAGIALVVSAIVQLSGPHTSVDELTLDLITAHKRFPIDVIGAVIDGIGLFALAATLGWLSEITKARNPEVRGFVRWLAIVGAILSGVMAIAYAIVIAQKASDFAKLTPQTYMQANHLTTGGLIVALPLLAQLGSLLLTGGFIWISLNSLRVGLLTRFMGYLGVFAGALVLFPIGSPVPVVQGFWLLALGLMFKGRWPSGQPEAWSSGTAVPWGPVGPPREPRAPARERGQSRGRPVKVTPPAKSGQDHAPDATPDDVADAARTRANTPKRKRKRRN